jgi:hypothetical protein
MNPRTPEIPRAAAEIAKPAQLLLARLIDYAGLFPPAALNMPQAVTNYDAYLRSEYAWMLGRFIVPAVRLNEFEETLGRLPSKPSKPWSISVLLGADPGVDIARLAASACPNARPFTVDSIEVKMNAPEDAKRLAAIIPGELKSYFEVPLAGLVRDCIAALAECGRSAKIRTGGDTADKIPAPAQVIEFIKLCADAKVPFKATAGLHHPIRSVHRLTYQPDSASALMHGFLNVFVAAAFLRKGMEPKLAVELLEELSAKAIQFNSDGITWREHQLGTNDIAAARQGFAVSFGSCSFTEPIDDLKSLGLL